jgi:hypothetical protein
VLIADPSGSGESWFEPRRGDFFTTRRSFAAVSREFLLSLLQHSSAYSVLP